MVDTTSADRVDTKSKVAVFGATGYTGRFVIAELLRRGITPIAIARDAKALSEAAFSSSEVVRRQAIVTDATSLDQALFDAHAVINCAGPFVDTAEAIANAALRSEIHYLDVSAEQNITARMLDTFDAPARKAGVVVMPSMAFYGGYSDLMVTALMGDWEAVDSIDIVMGIDQWHPTKGTRNTISRNAVGDLVVSGGRLVSKAASPRITHWNIPGPLGDQTVVEVPFSESILISRHVKTQELHNYIPQIALREVLDATTPPPEATDAMGRSAQQFVVEVVIKRGDEVRRAVSRGQDSYAVTAPLVCEAAGLLIKGQCRSTGAHAPGAIFDAKAFLSSLGRDYTFEILD